MILKLAEHHGFSAYGLACLDGFLDKPITLKMLSALAVTNEIALSSESTDEILYICHPGIF